MSNEQLGPLQVAALLVSASYGIGFLFGSGEFAVAHGMAGNLYPWLTGLGMLLLALLAGRIWRIGMPVWDLFGRCYGPVVKRYVAALSVVWMTGVLAAQIQGASTTLALAGVSRSLALPLVVVLVFLAGQLGLALASKIFSICLLGSSAVLLLAVIDFGGFDIYMHALARFAVDIRGVGTAQVATMAIAVVFLVVTGADYQQFVIAASNRRHAWMGCALAALVLIVVGALPASAVLAATHAGVLTHVDDAKQAIPLILVQMSDRFGKGAGAVMLLTLVAAALGSGAAVLRAMATAVLALGAGSSGVSRMGVSVLLVLSGGIVASRGQAIIETMVDLNIVYIASIAPLFALVLLNVAVSAIAAQRALIAGCITSLILYAMKWTGYVTGNAELAFLAAGMLASILTLAFNFRSPVRSG